MLWLPCRKWPRRAVWPELRGNGGHGLASLKQHLGLVFDHHDAGEDARAAAEVVLRTEGVQPVRVQGLVHAGNIPTADDEDFDLIEDCDDIVIAVPEPVAAPMTLDPIRCQPASSHIGMSEITQGNIDNSHIHPRSFFEKFPDRPRRYQAVLPQARLDPRVFRAAWGARRGYRDGRRGCALPLSRCASEASLTVGHGRVWIAWLPQKNPPGQPVTLQAIDTLIFMRQVFVRWVPQDSPVKSRSPESCRAAPPPHASGAGEEQAKGSGAPPTAGGAGPSDHRLSELVAACCCMHRHPTSIR